MVEAILYWFSIAWAIGITATAAYGIYQFVVGYRAAVIPAGTGTLKTIWLRMIAGTHNSATLLWARFVAMVGIGITLVIQLADFVGAPGVSAALQQYANPQVVAGIFIAVAVITEFARRRTALPSTPNA